jgi:transposase
LSGEKEIAEVDSNEEQGKKKMSRRNKHHTDEFKAEAVELVERSGKSVPAIAEDLGINARTLYHWLAVQKPKAISNQDASAADLAAENKRLRRELEIMRQERDILKKAMGVFAKESR